MAKIPFRTRRITPSGRVGDVFIPSDIADIGQGIEARGLAALGRGVSDLGRALFQIEQAEGISQAATARAQSNKEIQELELRLRQNNDTTTYQAELQESLQTIESFRPKSSIGSKRFDDFLSQSTPAWESGVAVLAFNKTKDIAEGAYISNLSDAVVSGDLVTATKVIEEARDTGVITNKQAVKDLANVPNRIIESQVKTVLNNASQFMSEGRFADAQIEITKAELILNDPEAKIDVDTEKALRSEVRTSKAQAQAKQKAQQDALTETLHQEYWQDLRQNNLAMLQNKIDVSILPVTGVGGKQWWTKIVSSRTKEIEKALEVKTDGKVNGDLLTDVYNISIGATTKTKFQQKLLQARYINRKLDDTDFDSLWLKSETEFKSWRGAQLQKSLRAIRAQVVTIDESTMERMIGILQGKALEEVRTRRQEEEDKYAEAVKEMDDWLAANPEPTRDEFYKQQRRLLRDYRNKTAEQIRQGRAEFKEIQTTQPTEEQLKAQAAATNDASERKRIYEQGRELGYWR